MFRVTTDPHVPLPITVLISLVDISIDDIGSVSTFDTKTILIEFLKAIGQPPIDVSKIQAEGDCRLKTQLLLSKKLKEALTALTVPDYKKLSALELELITDDYKAFCNEDILLPDYFYSLMCDSEVITVSVQTDGKVDVELQAMNNYDHILFSMGMDGRIDGGTVKRIGNDKYVLSLTEIDVPRPVKVKRGIILGTGAANSMLAPKENCRELLHRKYHFPLKQKASSPPEIKALSAGDESAFAFIENRLLRHSLLDLLKLADVKIFSYKIDRDDADYHIAYRELSLGERQAIIIAFNHYYFPYKDCHIIIDQALLETENTATLLLAKRRERNTTLFTFDDDAKSSTATWVDVIHLITRATQPPSQDFK